MRRLLAVLCLELLVAFNCPAQNHATQNGASAAPQVSREDLLKSLHDDLQRHSNLHDTYLYLASIGTKETVLLLERLRLDYGAHEPPPGMVMGFDCAQGHLVDALRAITNTDQGMFYPRWKAWWDANQDLTQHQWILKGFAQEGLSPGDPIDQRFGLGLIEIMGKRRDYLSHNAEKLLATVPIPMRTEWVVLSSRSADRYARLGATKVFQQIDKEGGEELLRGLTADDNPEVRRDALSVLNNHLRTAMETQPGGARKLRQNARGVAFLGNLLIAAVGSSAEAIDTQTWSQRWIRRMPYAVGDYSATRESLLVLGSYVGDLVALDVHGQIRWKSEARDKNDHIQKMTLYGDDLVVMRWKGLELRDFETGAVRSIAEEVQSNGIVSTPAHVFWIDKRGLHSWGDAPARDYALADAAGVSLTQSSVCVTSRESDHPVMCLDPESLALQWTQPVSSAGWFNDVQPIPDGERLYVLTDRDLTSFDAKNGTIFWSSSAGWEALQTISPCDAGILIQNGRYRLELRDRGSGEVLRLWPEIDGVSRLTVSGHIAAVTDLHGALWLIDLGK